MTVAKGIVAFVLLVAVGAASAQDMQRGLRNYQDIMAGRKKLEQLSPQEQREVIQVHRLVQSREDDAGKSSDCRNARNRARSSASDLADYARKLRSCAEAQDFTDDCDSELRRTRSAHSDYESAVSSVRSYCD